MMADAFGAAPVPQPEMEMPPPSPQPQFSSIGNVDGKVKEGLRDGEQEG